MKKVLVILLLFIFSAQGAVVALGGGLAMAGERSGMAQTAETTMTAVTAVTTEIARIADVASMAQDPPSGAGPADFDDLKVSSSIEEMSDYVALDPTMKPPRVRAPNPPTIAPVLSSIDLPRALPPPRG